MQNEETRIRTISLDGQWEVGIDRCYDRAVTVPGLATDPATPTQGTLWYRRAVALPSGTWTHATLTLNGARFCPIIYLNGQLVAASDGGMTVTTHTLMSEDVRPGNTIVLEIALQSLSDVDPRDASFIPQADHWRSNVSSCLWDHVSIRLHAAQRIGRLIPAFDLEQDLLTINWTLDYLIVTSEPLQLLCQVVNSAGSVLVEVQEDVLFEAMQKSDNGQGQIASSTGSERGIWDRSGMSCVHGRVQMALHKHCELWSPEHPHCYHLNVCLMQNGNTLDQDTMTLGLKTFSTEGLGFVLNGAPVHLRAGTVVWHRWLRDPEARELAFDVQWFEQNIVLRLKQHGANVLRFHLGMPPEVLLDLCDKHGLLVQSEWLFFHGMGASAESLREQWRCWLDLCLRHPSICLLHPWNETEGEQLAVAMAVLEELAGEYPPLVIAHRDVLHLHKYWWSLFENLGLYYDAADQFPLPIMVDEFGGNYLDGAANSGGYPALAESFQRFLGREHTAELRLQLHTEANTQVAEYWRRLGAAGFSPFCILGSPEDGNHHFLGLLRDGKPKPVWAGLTAAYAPLSCSLEIWDRNYLPSEVVTIPLYFFNESDQDAVLWAQVYVTNEALSEAAICSQTIACQVQAYGMAKQLVTLQLPATTGSWRLQAKLLNPPETVLHPVVSSWRFFTLRPQVPDEIKDMLIGVPANEPELQAFCAEYNLHTCSFDDPCARLLLLSAAGWHELVEDGGQRQVIERTLLSNGSVLLLDVGLQKLGYGYAAAKNGFLQGRISVQDPEVQELELVAGVRVRFREVAEPESCLHRAENDASLWENLQQQHTWLWNGLRGGLIVPAADMQLLGLEAEAFLRLWQTHGADATLIRSEADYCAYELAGFYAFSLGENAEIQRQLRARVAFMVEDAPALQGVVNPAAPIQIQHLSMLYRQRQQQTANITTFTSLATCGKNLARTAVVQIDFGKAAGRLLLSQVITRSRLSKRYGEEGLYGVRYDPATVQFTLNMMKRCIQTS